MARGVWGEVREKQQTPIVMARQVRATWFVQEIVLPIYLILNFVRRSRDHNWVARTRRAMTSSFDR